MLTGKDIILFILENNLVDKVLITKENLSNFLVDSDKVAEHFGVGIFTVKGLHDLGKIHGIKIDGDLYFPKSILETKGDFDFGQK